MKIDLDKNELTKLSKKFKAISTKGLIENNLINRSGILNGEK